MSEELLINITPQEARVAFVENGVLQDVHIERVRKRGLVGNIYRGRVSRILPGMQAAFVDIGMGRTAFLHASDIHLSHPVSHPLKDDEEHSPRKDDAITSLLREGQDIVVQVLKDPISTKGARLTTQLAIPSRYMVFMPNKESHRVSQKIEDAGERERLRGVVDTLSQTDMDGGGYIIRTAAEGAETNALKRDMEFIKRLWNAIRGRRDNAESGHLLYEDLPLVLRTLRDLVDSGIERVRIDSRETFLAAQDFADTFIPDLAPRIEHYTGERPIFDIYSVEDEIQRALEHKVQLKSGGHLIIEQTEAMITLDVNTGAFVGRRNLEETVFKTNLEATQAIARQLRLRNLGGIIIIDFIDMADPEHRRQVLQSLEKALSRDYAKTRINEVSKLGLVEMTRKRTRESLGHLLCQTCPICDGRGTLKTPETVCYEIFREIIREARAYDARELRVLAAQEVVDMLLDEESTSIAELEELIGKPIRFQVETFYTQEQFDVVLL